MLFEYNNDEEKQSPELEDWWDGTTALELEIEEDEKS